MKYMSAFARIAKSVDVNSAGNLVYNIGVIGENYPEEAQEHKPYLKGTEKLASNQHSPEANARVRVMNVYTMHVPLQNST